MLLEVVELVLVELDVEVDVEVEDEVVEVAKAVPNLFHVGEVPDVAVWIYM